MGTTSAESLARTTGTAGHHSERTIHAMADDSAEATIERIHCNVCRQRTRHQRLCKTVDTETEELVGPGSIDWVTTQEALQCCGCGMAVLRRTVVCDIDEWNTVQYFPPGVSRHPPSWRRECPTDMRDVLDEVYRSLDANNRRLPMMGARTLIDMLMVDEVGDVGTFTEKLKKLEGLGVISSRNREVLAVALDVGNAAAHRGHAPKADEVNAVMDIVENLLHAVYVLPKMAENLKKTTPPRPRPRKKSTP